MKITNVVPIWRRSFARIIDYLLLSLIIVFAWLLIKIIFSFGKIFSDPGSLILMSFFQYILCLLYFTLFPFFLNGYTIGKKIMKINLVINKVHTLIIIKDLLLREIWISWILYILDFTYKLSLLYKDSLVFALDRLIISFFLLWIFILWIILKLNPYHQFNIDLKNKNFVLYK